MSYPINYPTPQGANIQIFQDGGTTSDWVKPQGASFIWVTLIGSGGSGGSSSASNGGGGGGSGAVTNYMGPAFLIPDVLRVYVGKSSLTASAADASTLTYQQKDNTGYLLLNANGGVTAAGAGTSIGVGGAASVSNYFSCMGFFQSVAGQNGSLGGTGAPTDITASATTYLSGGAGGAGNLGAQGGGVTANYGYSLPQTTSGGTVAGYGGFFQMQPIIVGVGGTGGTTTTGIGTQGGKGGIGCGGGGAGEDANLGGLGGDGMVVIITW